MFGKDQLKLYEELRREINIVAKVDPTTDESPDPVTLNSIDRRILVKSIFSFIEASSNSMKANAVDSRNAWVLTQGERMLAEEKDYKLNEQGVVTPDSPRLKTLPNIRFAFTVFAKATRADFKLDVSGEGWRQLQSSLKVRDRLMHPKALGDVIVTDDEIRDAMRAFKWFTEQERAMLVAVIYSLESQAKNADEHLVVDDAELDDEG